MFDNPMPPEVANVFGLLRESAEDDALTEAQLRSGFTAAQERLAALTDAELAELDEFVDELALSHENDSPPDGPIRPAVRPRLVATRSRRTRRQRQPVSARGPRSARGGETSSPAVIEIARGTTPLALPEPRSPYSTLAVQRSVLFVTHTLTSVHRLLDILPLLEVDDRVQVVYTQAPDALGRGVEQWLRDLEVPVSPWQQATRQVFDLAISASLHRMNKVKAAAKLTLPHGAGYNKRWPAWGGVGTASDRPVYGLDRESLLDNGSPVFDAIVLPHQEHLSTLVRQCPESVGSAVVAGDPCYDRLVGAMTDRDHYRSELGVRASQVLVAVASTWGRKSLLATQRELLSRLTAELPANHRVIMTLHPAVWAEHGPRQVRTWLRDVREAGVELVDAGEDWRALVAAADVVIADHSSVGVYAAAVGVPLLMSEIPEDEVDSQSVVAELAELSPRLSATTPLLAQLQAAREAGRRQWQVASSRVSSVRGNSTEVIQRTLYQLMGMDRPPARKSPWVPLPVPKLVRDTAASTLERPGSG